MPRAIVWALGTIAAAAVAAPLAGNRLAGSVGLSRPQLQLADAPKGPDGGLVTVAADLRGHFVVHPTLDGRRIRMLVDTGASLVALSHEDARLSGIEVPPGSRKHRIATANGIVEAAAVRIGEVRIGGIAVRNVEAVVLPPGRLGTSLLGMSFLKRLGGFEISQGRLTLRS